MASNYEVQEAQELRAENRQFIKSMAPRLGVLAVMCVVVQMLMAFSYMGAFGKPEAKSAPFIVVSRHEGNAGYVANKLNDISSHPVNATISTNLNAALGEVKKNHAVGAYVFNPSDKSDALYYASAQGASRVQVAQTVATQVAAQAKRPLQQHDVVKVAPDDTRGTAAFYLVLAWMVGSYLLPSAISTVAGARARSAQGARLRLVLFAGYALLSGFAGTFVAQHWLNALPGSYWKISLMGSVLVFAVSTFSYGLMSLLGTVGIGLAILLFVIIGNPSAGGAYAYDVLPQPWRAIGPYMPNGAGVDAVRSIAYFGSVDLTRPLWVVALWLLVGLWVLFMVGNNTYRFAPGGVSVPEDPAHEDHSHEGHAEHGRHHAGHGDETQNHH